MRVAIVQSSYIPWRGHFDIIDSVDTFVFLDDVQYTRRSWRTRNAIRTESGTRWLTIPVLGASQNRMIFEMEIDESSGWRKKHLEIFRQSYRGAKYFDEAYRLFKEVLGIEHSNLSGFNQAATKLISAYLGIETNFASSTTLSTSGSKTDKLLAILRKLGATSYLSGPTARGYLDHAKLHQHGISTWYKTYDYPDYPQYHGNFDGAVSVLDLIANCGQDCKPLITSTRAHEAAEIGA